jgi:hypothetical protein
VVWLCVVMAGGIARMACAVAYATLRANYLSLECWGSRCVAKVAMFAVVVGGPCLFCPPLPSITYHCLPLPSIAFQCLPMPSITFHYLPMPSNAFHGQHCFCCLSLPPFASIASLMAP